LPRFATRRWAKLAIPEKDYGVPFFNADVEQAASLGD